MSNKFLLHSHAIRVSFDHEIAVLQPFNKALLALEGNELKTLFDTGIDNGVTQFVLDLSNAEYIASEALGAVATCWGCCNDGRKGRMAVVLSPDEHNEVRNLFDIIGLSRMIGSSIKTCLKDAINYLREFP
jgi:hypothetical protein